MPKYNWEDFDEFEEEIHQERVNKKTKPKRKKKSYHEIQKRKQSNQVNKKHPNRS
jgi:hypothetical protein